MFLSWVAFPLVVLCVSFGCGLLVERAAGWRIPGPILAGIGLALIIVVADLTTQSTVLAPQTPWLIVGLAALGWGSSLRRLRELRLDLWTLALAICLFAVFAAPIVLSGHPTFGGYGVDGDPAVHFLLALEVLAHGHRSLHDLPNATYPSVQIMGGYLTSGYPLGSDLAVGALRVLVGAAIPWVYAPFIAVTLTLGGLALEELTRDLVESRPLRTLCAFIAAQAGLAYSFYLISSIKELVTTWLAALLVTLVVLVLRRPPSPRALVPLAVVASAALYTLAVPAIPWIWLPLLALVLVLLWRIRRSLPRPSWPGVAGTAGLIVFAILISLPALRTVVTSFTTTSTILTGSATSGSALGELLSPLSKYEIFGIWPVGDFRRPISLHVTLIHILIWTAMASACVGALWALARRAWGPVLLIAGNGIATAVLLGQATPYAASKVEAIVSTTALLAAMLGAAALSRLARPLGWALAVVLALAVLWTNDKSLRAAPLAPQPRFAELERIDTRFAGRGPVLYDLSDAEYGAYFTRRLGSLDPGLYEYPVTRPGTIFPAGLSLQTPYDPNDLDPTWERGLRAFVLGRSPVLSRPPADFRLAFRGRYYNVYMHRRTPRVLVHVPVAPGPLGPSFSLPCARIGHLAAQARRERARLAYAPKLALASVEAQHSTHPPTWLPYPPIRKDPAGAPIPGGLALSTVGGTLTSTIRVPRSGRYTVWLEGSITQRITVTVAGRTVGSIADQIGPGGLWGVVGTVGLSAGVQRVRMNRAPAGRLQSVGVGDVLGSLVLTRGAGPPPVRTLRPQRWRALCRTPMQWLEIVR